MKQYLVLGTAVTCFFSLCLACGSATPTGNVASNSANNSTTAAKPAAPAARKAEFSKTAEAISFL